MPIQTAVIGAGSVGFTRAPMHDVPTFPARQDAEFVFTDAARLRTKAVDDLRRERARKARTS